MDKHEKYKVELEKKRREIHRLKISDREKVIKLNTDFQMYRKTAPNTVFNIAGSAERLAKKIKYKEGIAGAYFEKAVCRFHQGMFSRCRYWVRRGLDIDFENTDDPVYTDLRYHFYSVLASSYERVGEFVQARRWYTIAMEELGRQPDRPRFASLVHNYGAFLFRNHLDKREAMEYARQAEELCLTYGHTVLYLEVKGLFAADLMDLHEYDAALDIYTYNIEAFKALDKPMDVARELNNIGNTLIVKGELESGKEKVDESLKLRLSSQTDQVGVMYCYHGYVRYYMEVGNKAEAEYYKGEIKRLTKEKKFQEGKLLLHIVDAWEWARDHDVSMKVVEAIWEDVGEGIRDKNPEIFELLEKNLASLKKLTPRLYPKLVRRYPRLKPLQRVITCIIYVEEDKNRNQILKRLGLKNIDALRARIRGILNKMDKSGSSIDVLRKLTKALDSEEKPQK